MIDVASTYQYLSFFGGFTKFYLFCRFQTNKALAAGLLIAIVLPAVWGAEGYVIIGCDITNGYIILPACISISSGNSQNMTVNDAGNGFNRAVSYSTTGCSNPTGFENNQPPQCGFFSGDELQLVLGTPSNPVASVVQII
jgi:hypothetical protein